MSRVHALGLGLALALCRGSAWGDPPAAPPPSGTLVVRVTVRSDVEGTPPRPLAGAAVAVSDEEGERAKAATDAQGVARFERLPEGDVTVRVEADRFVAEEKEAAVEAGREATLPVALAAGVPFDGTVLDLETRAPVADARVEVEARGAVGGYGATSFRAPYARTRTDAKGRFHVNGVPEGGVATVEAAAPGHAAAAFPLRILGGQVTPSPVVLRLPPGGSVAGVVRDARGQPVPDATVFVFPAASEKLRENPRGWTLDASTGRREQAVIATTGADGGYLVDGLPLDVEYAVLAEAEGFSRSETAEGLRPDAKARRATADLVLRAAALLVVRLVDLSGKPVLEKAEVQVGEGWGGRRERKEEPDEANAYRFAGLDPGEWPVKVESPSFRTTWAKGVVEPGKTTEVTVRLDPGLSIEGLAVDEEGKPVVGATVGVKTVGGEDPSPSGVVEMAILGRTAHADEAGRFVVRGLSPKEAEVDAFGFRGPEKDSYRTTDAVRVTPPAKGLRLVLVRRGSALIRLATPEGKPYAGRSMVWEGKKQGGSRHGSGRTIADGTVVFTSLEDADYEVSIDLADYLTVRREFRARLRERVDLGTVTLDPGLEVKGRVVDLAGTPVPGARVSGDESTVAADEHGAFLLPHEPRGRIRVQASADGFLGAARDADVAPGMAPVEVRLPRGAVVRGVVRDADGQPAQEDVFFWRIGPDGKRLDDHEELVSPEEDGTFSERVAPGRYRIVARAAARGGVPPPLGDFTFAEGETREVTLTLPRP